MGRIQRVVFLRPNVFTRREYKRQGIDILLQRFDVEVWDCSAFCNPEMVGERSLSDSLVFSGLRYVESPDGFRSLLAGVNSSTAVVSQVGFGTKENWMWNQLINAGSFVGLQHTDSQALGAWEETSLLAWIRSSIKRLARRVMSKQVPDSNVQESPAPAQFVLAGPRKTPAPGLPLNSSTQMIRMHCADYDLFLQTEKRTPDAPSKFIVFLDEYMPFHPDYAFYGVRPPVSDPAAYYRSMCEFFDRVEFELGLPVIIAAHPRAQYEKHPDYFRGRKIVSGQTIELVRDCDAVIAHNSKSVNFAVMYERPVIICHIPHLQNSAYKRHVDALAKALRVRPIDPISQKKLNANRLRRIDGDAYAEFFADYIKTPGTPNGLMWNTFSDFFAAVGT